MTFLQTISEYGTFTIFTLFFFAFLAGFIDAVVGGGGLIQAPALLIALPHISIPTLFGTNKIAALAGTSIAAFQYSKRVKFDYRLLLTIAFFAGVFAFLGAKLVSFVDVNTLKPLILLVLIVIAIYTFFKKDLGTAPTKNLSPQKLLILGSFIGVVVGFYDGFFGPGTGSFFVLGFVTILGFDFLHASAYAKVVNCMTNIAALLVFIRQGNYILAIAIIMAIANMAGNTIGSRMAMKQGNEFIRKLFLVVVSLMIVRYGYDIFGAK